MKSLKNLLFGAITFFTLASPSLSEDWLIFQVGEKLKYDKKGTLELIDLANSKGYNSRLVEYDDNGTNIYYATFSTDDKEKDKEVWKRVKRDLGKQYAPIPKRGCDYTHSQEHKDEEERIALERRRFSEDFENRKEIVKSFRSLVVAYINQDVDKMMSFYSGGLNLRTNDKTTFSSGDKDLLKMALKDNCIKNKCSRLKIDDLVNDKEPFSQKKFFIEGSEAVKKNVENTVFEAGENDYLITQFLNFNMPPEIIFRCDKKSEKLKCSVVAFRD